MLHQWVENTDGFIKQVYFTNRPGGNALISVFVVQVATKWNALKNKL
jgi:hypothetical protein